MIHYFTDRTHIEENAVNELQSFIDDGCEIAVFPDIHFTSAESAPVGTAIKSNTYLYPTITGKDAGCGVAFMRFKGLDVAFDKEKHYKSLERTVHSSTDEGLGSGNHFLSIERSNKYLYIIVHTGTRNRGIGMFQKFFGALNGERKLRVEDFDFYDEYVDLLNYGKVRREEFLFGIRDFLIRNKYISETDVYEVYDSIHNHFTIDNDTVIHRKGATELVTDEIVCIPLSLSRGCLIVKANIWDEETIRNSLSSCAHGAGRAMSRSAAAKYFYNMKKSEKKKYYEAFPELVGKGGTFSTRILQELDFAYKPVPTMLEDQPHLIKEDETEPIVTVKMQDF